MAECAKHHANGYAGPGSTAGGSITGFPALGAVFGKLRAFKHDRSGATAIEYSLIAGLIFLVIVGSVRNVATKTTATYTKIDNAVDAAVNP